MNFKERTILYYLIGAIILSRILVVVLTWFRTFITTLLMTFLIVVFSRFRRNSPRKLRNSHSSAVESPQEPSGASGHQRISADETLNGVHGSDDRKARGRQLYRRQPN